ncbi:MAG: aminotransferase class I/II-fold pyridoxal phosphate-dependent enzyme [Desulfomonilaceae bacterium]|nr:aminotransferase class I/II-fold pyridoxal phosphate-dependent enzyme [Desulfomonilaceae bacterium]
MTLELKSLEILHEALSVLETGFDSLPEFAPEVDVDALRSALMEAAEKMRDNQPFPHPLYIGQMIKPPHSIARLAYMLSLWINPNNHALDGGRCSSAMEKEAVAEIAKMFEWSTFLGHLCGGGTMANLEALWISKRLSRGGAIVASDQAHYTHRRVCEVLDIPFESVPCDSAARMNVNALEKRLEQGNVGTVVASMGTTATGSVDPLVRILQLQETYGFRIHADAAYGGYFTLADNLLPETRAAYDHLSEVDSIAVDPHKHGLQPYGCGCILFKDPAVGKFYKHDSPYTYFSSQDLHLGEISLECSRPGSAAVALWTTQKLFPLTRGGRFAGDLAKCRSAALRLYDLLTTDGRFMTALPPELDIVIWAPRAPRASEASRLCEAIFDAAEARGLYMAKANMPKSLLVHHRPDLEWDQEHVTCLRSCLMKPEHLEWMDRIWDALDVATTEVMS